MNLDIASVFSFGDADALRLFMLDHNTVHAQESVALNKRFGGVFSTFGLLDALAESDWIALMERGAQGERMPTPSALEAWLEQHALMHNQTYAAIGGTGGNAQAPDLSLVDFSDPVSFYTWMFVHQQMHDYEESFLRIS